MKSTVPIVELGSKLADATKFVNIVVESKLDLESLYDAENKNTQCTEMGFFVTYILGLTNDHPIS